ncbi:MAG: NAD(P)-dependent oxidoreductase [Planctomycetota bacterium]
MTEPQPIIAVTRRTPGFIRVPGAETRILSDRQPSRGDTLSFVAGASIVASMFSDRIDAELLDAAGPSLRGVCNFAVGYDNIDLADCRKRGIVVCNTPDAVTEGTANIAFLLLLAASRRLIEADRFARSDDYPSGGPLGMGDFLGQDLVGKLLLIVGAGRIGYATALRARSFGMRIGYVARSRHIDFEMGPLGGERFDLNEGLRQADAVSIHTPLTDATRGLLSRERIGLLKPTAVVVNTARGPVIDETALAEALQAKRLWGVGLDVYEKEPEVHPILKDHPRAVLTPHIGSAEVRWREAMAEMVSTNAAAILSGREPPNRLV